MRSPFLWLAIALHIALATSYAWCTPTFEGPDENSHYEYAWHIGNARQLPLTTALANKRELPQTEGAVLGHHPPLYYALLGTAMRLTGTDDTVFGPRINAKFGLAGEPSRRLRFLHEEQPHHLLFYLRLVSVLLGAITIACVHGLGRTACANAPRVADLAALLVAALPMFSSLHGLLNNGVLATTLSAATLLLLARMLRSERVGAGPGIGLGLLLGAAFLTKLTTLFLGGLAGIAAVILLVRKRTNGKTLTASLLTAAAVSGWMFWRNFSLYGDALGMSAHDQAFQPIPEAMRWHYFFGLDPWPDSVPSFLPTVFTSLFGRFGWFSQPPHIAIVWAAAVIAAMALIGLLVAAFDRERKHIPRPLWLLLSACALVFAGTAYFNLSAPQPQARLLFPAVAPAAVLLAAGLVRCTETAPFRKPVVMIGVVVSVVIFLVTFLPKFDPHLAPAPRDHRSLVGAIASNPNTAAITWTTESSQTPLDEPPTLRWQDPGAPAGTRYTLYAFDDDGRVWLATHEWSHGGVVIDGSEFSVPETLWNFLPHQRAMSLRIRRVPANANEPAREQPSSACLTVVRK